MKIIVIVLIVLFVLCIGGLIYTHILLYQVIKDDRKSIDWGCMIWCIGLFFMEILLALGVLSAK